MILIQTRNWFGPSRHAQSLPQERMKSSETLVTLATRLPLAEALAALKNYQHEFDRVFGERTASEYTVLGVQYLPEDLSDDDLENARIMLIETMDANLLDEPTWWEKSATPTAHPIAS